MVETDIAINTVTRVIPLDTSIDSTFTYSADLAKGEALIAHPVSTSGSSTSDRIYDFTAMSEGASGVLLAHVHSRSLVVNKNITVPNKIVISDFFQAISNIADTRLQAVPRIQKDGSITYDVFCTYIGGASGADGDLTVITLEVEPGSFPTIPTTPDVLIAADMVLREVRGLTRIYDIFMLSVGT